MFGSLERERRVEWSRGKESSGEESTGEWFPLPCLDVFKIRMERRKNDLNR